MILPASVQVWLATEPVDMRRGHDGLLALVRVLGIADPYSGHLFVFLGRRADRCKILFWDRGGFVVAYKRLERGRFRLPRSRPMPNRSPSTPPRSRCCSTASTCDEFGARSYGRRENATPRLKEDRHGSRNLIQPRCGKT